MCLEKFNLYYKNVPQETLVKPFMLSGLFDHDFLE